MTIIHRQALVLHSANKMYQLVDNIEQYPEFLPWCKSAHELSRNEDEVKAQLELTWGGLHKTFTTLNRLQPGKMIDINLVNGPFKHLEGYWQFDALDQEACKVSLSLEFEFLSRMISMAFSKVIEQVAGKLVNLFCERADELHGRND